MKLLWRLAKRSVILLDEVPSYLILGQVSTAISVSARCLSSAGSVGILLSGIFVGLLLARSSIGGSHFIY